MVLIRSYKNVLVGLTLLCLILLAASAYLFFNDAAAMRHAGFLKGGWHKMRSADSPVPTGIRTWMTFDFINDIFHLSPDYLQDALSVRSAAYPKMTVAQAARAQGIAQEQFLLKVQSAVASSSVPRP